MTASSVSCPACGAPASGKFCNSCGAPLAGAACPNCDAPLSSGARFCHQCGTPLGARRSRSLPLPWVVTGVAIVALIAVAGFAIGRSAGTGATASAPSAARGGGGIAPASDISRMTPREQANRLFDRVMSLAERGITDSVTFFKPMAIQAYALLGAPDNDARYDLGMIHAVTGDYPSALAQADSLDVAVPGHLLASVIRHAVAEARNDRDTARRAQQAFLRSYAEEIARERPEYGAHRPTLEAFVAEARRAVGGT